MTLFKIKKKTVQKYFKISVTTAVLGTLVGAGSSIYNFKAGMIVGGSTALIGVASAAAIHKVFEEKLDVEVWDSEEGSGFSLDNLVEVEE
jgi:hypothetical protein